MAAPYIGEIRMFGGNFAPAGWDFCEGQLLPISEFEALFNLIGTTYGGDGQNTFALPDLRGRVPVHQGAGSTFAQSGGVENVTLTLNQIPGHTHIVAATTNPGTQSAAAGNLLASGVAMYSSDTPNHALSQQAVGIAGGNQPHSNFQPYLCVSFIISLFGVFPSQG